MEYLDAYAIQYVADCVEVKGAEDRRALDCGGRVLLSIDGWYRGSIPQIPPGQVGILSFNLGIVQRKLTQIYEDNHTSC
jgi:hypothetical protein